ncbi:MAG TPA: MarR family transcriptional regulator [Streptosporangiaceae bacterium]|nr:MarR family transcriptional regulator [Streptosporangiaceae bacterium]
MENRLLTDGGQADRRSGLNLAIREALRDLSVALSLLNQRIGGHLDLKGTDLQCLDLIDRRGPLSPSTLARLAGLHPATMTGVIDRLERGGWIMRERDPADRRGVVLRPVPGRRADLLRLASGMNAEVARICADYSSDDLKVIAAFLRRTAEAGRTAGAHLDAS